MAVIVPLPDASPTGCTRQCPWLPSSDFASQSCGLGQLPLLNVAIDVVAGCLGGHSIYVEFLQT